MEFRQQPTGDLTGKARAILIPVGHAGQSYARDDGVIPLTLIHRISSRRLSGTTQRHSGRAISAQPTQREDPLRRSKAQVGFAPKVREFARSAALCLGLLARHLLTLGTTDHPIALIDPEFNAPRPGNLDGPKSTLKISSHGFFPRLSEAVDRIHWPRVP